MRTRSVPSSFVLVLFLSFCPTMGGVYRMATSTEHVKALAIKGFPGGSSTSEEVCLPLCLCAMISGNTRVVNSTSVQAQVGGALLLEHPAPPTVCFVLALVEQLSLVCGCNLALIVVFLLLDT